MRIFVAAIVGCFYSLYEAKVLIEMWREHYNKVRPHSSLGYRPPAPEAVMEVLSHNLVWFVGEGHISLRGLTCRWVAMCGHLDLAIRFSVSNKRSLGGVLQRRPFGRLVELDRGTNDDASTVVAHRIGSVPK